MRALQKYSLWQLRERKPTDSEVRKTTKSGVRKLTKSEDDVFNYLIWRLSDVTVKLARLGKFQTMPGQQ